LIGTPTNTVQMRTGSIGMIVQLAAIHKYRLLTPAELGRFTARTRETIEWLGKEIMRQD